MRDPGGRRQERGEGKEGEVGLLWIRWPSQKVPLKMVVQAREGFGLASMGTLVSPAYCCLIYIYIYKLTERIVVLLNAIFLFDLFSKINFFRLFKTFH